MAFSLGRTLGSFASRFVPTAFESSLGLLEPINPVSIFMETPMGEPSPHDRQSRPTIGREKNAGPKWYSGDYWNTPLKSGQTRAKLLYDVGSVLRDPDDGWAAELPDPIMPHQSFNSGTGGGVGGVGGVGRKNTRWRS